MVVKASIIIPVYNREQYLAETLDSVLGQTLTDWECLLIDDGSNDSTLRILNKYVEMDKRFKLHFNNKKKGANSCRNIGIDSSIGIYCLFLDSDDIITHNCLKQRINFIENNQNLDFCVFPEAVFYSTVGDSDHIINIPSSKKDLYRFMTIAKDAPWMTTGPLWRVSSLRLASLRWDEHLFSYQDIDFHIAALIKDLNYSFVYCKPDRFLRLHSDTSISKSLESNKGCESIAVIAKKVLNYSSSFEGDIIEYTRYSMPLVFYAIQSCIRQNNYSLALSIEQNLKTTKNYNVIGKIGITIYLTLSVNVKSKILARYFRYFIMKLFYPWLAMPTGSFRLHTIESLSKSSLKNPATSAKIEQLPIR
jgi:glycosyltransferase involved in cell wall biosynthesis